MASKHIDLRTAHGNCAGMECEMNSTLRILRLKQVKEKVGLSRSQIYALISTGHFPRQISLGARAVGWIQGDIDRWIMQRAAAKHQHPNSKTPDPDFGKMESPSPKSDCALQPAEGGAQ